MLTFYSNKITGMSTAKLFKAHKVKLLLVTIKILNQIKLYRPSRWKFVFGSPNKNSIKNIQANRNNTKKQEESNITH